MTLDQGGITKLPIRQAVRKLTHLFEKATTEATNVREACIYSAVAVARYALTADAKLYMDIKGTFDGDGFCRSLDEWQKTHPGKQVWEHKARQPVDRTPSRVPGRRQGSCFHCGKQGHFASECRSRLAGSRPAYQQQEGVPPPSQPFYTKQEPQMPMIPRPEVPRPARGERDMSKVTCFHCRQQGHISTSCPKKNAAKVKKVKVREELIERLRTNEVFGAVGPYRMPVTCDTGADITVVPEEAVQPEEFTGGTCELRSFNDGQSEGKRCVATISAGKHTFTREAVTQPGKALGWSVCLSLSLNDPKDRAFLTEQIEERHNLTEKDILYIPPEVRDGFLISGIPVNEAHVVKGVKGKPDTTEDVPVLAAQAEAVESEERVSSETPVTETSVDTGSVDSKDDEEDRVAVEGESLVDGGVLEQVEDSGDSLEGSAETEGTLDIHVEKIRERMSLTEMIEETKSDTTLTTIVKLAELERDGFHMSQGLAFRTRLDTFGLPVEQLCVPTTFRKQCLKAAHSSFGHQGRNRMVALLRPHFYWPCMARDCVAYIRSCETCQAMDRTLPRPPMMKEREVVTTPFSDVAVDIVGPFPTAKGGFKYMLTCIDTASRWPEAFALRSTTSRAVIRCLTQVFTRWGFPEKLTSDNGPQFTSATFTRWLRDKGIAHARATPYHPQANGIVEWLHRTLNSVIAKTVACKGDWAAVLPMVLFFLRCTPTRSTGMSPFLITHGWEPSNPIQLLYKSWVDSELGGVDLSEWVLDNAQRVESAREQATLKLVENSQYRATRYNLKAKDRTFTVGDRVWVRRPGLDDKLAESWVGPGTILKVNSPTSFKVQTPDRTIPTVAIQQIKLAGKANVKRITTVVEDRGDDLTSSYASSSVVSQQLTDEQTQQLEQMLDRHSKTLTKDPGITSLVEFDIDTGGAEPIHQRPYSTPVALKEKVDEEITWLLSKGYIVPSSSPWASPMVTVRKADGSARLCVDFRKINGLTRQMPFFMPRVEEVVEGIGRAKFVSKIDLSKGFYQVPLTKAAMEKTAFTCHRGAFHFTRMPFGVKNAPACFQTLMQRVLADVTEFSTAYMDDVVIYSPTWEDHVVHVNQVLDRIGRAGLTVNPKKCCWGGRAIEFLWHFVGRGQMSIPAHRCTALATYTKPRTKKGLRAFLGSVGFYRRYLEKLAHWTSLLTPKTGKQAPQIVEWSGEEEVAFNSIRAFFCNPSTLCVPVIHDVISIVSDASGRGIGGVLQVRRDGEWWPAAYFSRQLRGAEHRYSATELEALALTETIRHFAYHLYGRLFQDFTDHKPLEQLTTSTRLNPRLARLAFKLQEWMVKIEYLPGDQNTLADALSREERDLPDKKSVPVQDGEEDVPAPGRHLAWGDVGETPPH